MFLLLLLSWSGWWVQGSSAPPDCPLLCSLDPASDRVGLPCTAFDHSRAHYYRFDEHVLLCLEKQRSVPALAQGGGPRWGAHLLLCLPYFGGYFGAWFSWKSSLSKTVGSRGRPHWKQQGLEGSWSHEWALASRMAGEGAAGRTGPRAMICWLPSPSSAMGKVGPLIPLRFLWELLPVQLRFASIAPLQ